jgi:hypothetical protein
MPRGIVKLMPQQMKEDHQRANEERLLSRFKVAMCV